MSYASMRDPEAFRVVQAYHNRQEAINSLTFEELLEAVVDAISLANWMQTYLENNKAENCP